MKKTLVTAALAVLIGIGATSPVLAGSCPWIMKAVDAALAAGPTLSSAQISEVKALRAKGEAEHKAGKHGASMKSLKQAMAVLE